MTDPEQDEVFEAYLKRRPVLPAVDDQLEPPVGLDQKVLAAARDAIGPQRAGVGSGRGVAGAGGAAGGGAANGGAGGDNERAKQQMNRAPRWAVPIALAATILLSLSIVINISLNTNRPAPNRQRVADTRADVKASAEANAIAESDAAAGVPARTKSPAMAFNDGERRERTSGAISSNEVVLPGAKVAGVAKPRVPVEAETVAPAGRAPAAEPPASASAADLADRAQAAPALAAKDEVSPSAAPPAPDSSPLAAAAPSRLAAPPPSTPAQLASRQKARSANANEPAAEPAAASPHPTDPKVWLQQINALRAAGKTEQAAAEMRRFKAAFPGYAVPPAPAAQSVLPKSGLPK